MRVITYHLRIIVGTQKFGRVLFDLFIVFLEKEKTRSESHQCRTVKVVLSGVLIILVGYEFDGFEQVLLYKVVNFLHGTAFVGSQQVFFRFRHYDNPFVRRGCCRVVTLCKGTDQHKMRESTTGQSFPTNGVLIAGIVFFHFFQSLQGLIRMCYRFIVATPVERRSILPFLFHVLPVVCLCHFRTLYVFRVGAYIVAHPFHENSASFGISIGDEFRYRLVAVQAQSVIGSFIQKGVTRRKRHHSR